MSKFEEKLKIGKLGESEIAQWLKSRGHHILPVYEIEKNQYAGPSVYSSGGESIIAPDMLIFGKGKTIWVEAKHKEAFTLHRITNNMVTGIDLHHYFEYQKILDLVDWPVWLMFLHRGGQAKDSPISSSGLYCGELRYLMKNENHRHDKWGKSGMVYWAENKLKKISNYPLGSDQAGQY